MSLRGELFGKQTVGHFGYDFFLLALEEVEELLDKVAEFDLILEEITDERGHSEEKHLRLVAYLIHLHLDLVEQLYIR